MRVRFQRGPPVLSRYLVCSSWVRSNAASAFRASLSLGSSSRAVRSSFFARQHCRSGHRTIRDSCVDTRPKSNCVQEFHARFGGTDCTGRLHAGGRNLRVSHGQLNGAKGRSPGSFLTWEIWARFTSTLFCSTASHSGHEALFLECIPHLQEHFVIPARVENGVYVTAEDPGSSSDLRNVRPM